MKQLTILAFFIFSLTACNVEPTTDDCVDTAADTPTIDQAVVETLERLEEKPVARRPKRSDATTGETQTSTETVKDYYLIGEVTKAPLFGDAKRLKRSDILFNQWVAKNLNEVDATDKVEKVLVSFDITTEGKITNITSAEGDTSAWAKEAIRVVSLMAQDTNVVWTPGSVDGVPVTTRVIYPIVW